MNSDFKFEPKPSLSEAEREKRLALARENFRKSAERIKALGLPDLTDEEIDAEIAEVRRERVERANAAASRSTRVP